MNDKQIIWTTKKIKELVDYIEENTPLDEGSWAGACRIADEITDATTKNGTIPANMKVATAVTSVLGLFEKMYKKG